MNIKVVQFYTKNVAYGKYAEEINKQYCEETGYDYHCEKDTEKILSALESRAATWYKPKLILEALNSTVDYVLFLDIDAVVSDTNQRIEDFIDEAYDLILAEDVGHHSVANAGVILVKNTEWSRDFLNKWWDSAETYKGRDAKYLEITEDNLEKVGYFKNALWHDQTCFTTLYNNDEDIKKHVKIISNRSFNYRDYNQNNFIFHAFSYGHLENRTLDVIYRQKMTPKPETNNINLIVYHIYCVGDYINVVNRQLNRLKSSGLYDWCDKLEITCVNTEGDFTEVEDLLKDLSKATLNKFTTNGFEYEGIKKVWDYSQTYTGKVFYFHTKGVSNKYKDVISKEDSEWKKKGVSWWKEAMEYFLIDNFEDCLAKLEEYDQCGLTMNNRWWWGNFWWTDLSWVFNNLMPEQGGRWYFEAWLNSYRDPKIYEYYHFEFNPYYSVLPEDIYRNRELYKDSKIEITKAFYGTLGEQQDEGRVIAERKGVDVTDHIKKEVENNNGKGLTVKADNSIAGDPYYGIEKVLEVYFLLNGQECILVVDENRILNFQLK